LGGFFVEEMNGLDDILFSEIVPSTMKSKRVWMKSKLCSFDEIKSVFLSAAGDFITE